VKQILRENCTVILSSDVVVQKSHSGNNKTENGCFTFCRSSRHRPVGSTKSVPLRWYQNFLHSTTKNPNTPKIRKKQKTNRRSCVCFEIVYFHTKMTDEVSPPPVPFTYFANAQTEFASSIPLVANENAFLGDIAFRYRMYMIYDI
jgi:hypothetical protein